MEYSIKIGFKDQAAMMQFMKLMVNAGLADSTEIEPSAAQRKVTSATYFVADIEEEPADKPGEKIKCANPKCGKMFLPKRGGKCCSSKCSAMASFYKKKALSLNQKTTSPAKA